MSYFRKMLQEMQQQDCQKQSPKIKSCLQIQQHQPKPESSRFQKKTQSLSISVSSVLSDNEQIPKERTNIQKPSHFPSKNLITSLLSSKVRMLRQIQAKKNKFSEIKIQALRIKQSNLNKKLIQSSRIKESTVRKQSIDLENFCSSANKEDPLSGVKYISERKTQRQKMEVGTLKQELEIQMMSKIMKLLENQAQQRKKEAQIERSKDKCEQNIVNNKSRPTINLNSQKLSYSSIDTPLSSTAKSHKLQSGYLQHPIIINNIVRETPSEKIDKSLIERQIKIKLLQQQRKNKQFQQSRCYRTRPSMYQEQMMHSQYRHRRDYSELVKLNNVSPVNQYYRAVQEASAIKIKPTISQKTDSYSNSKNKDKFNLQIPENDLDNASQCQDNPATSKFFYPQLTFSDAKKHSSRESKGQIEVNDGESSQRMAINNKQIKQNNQSQFTRQERRKKRQQNKTNQHLIKSQFLVEKRQIELPKRQAELLKKPVLIQIPFDQNSAHTGNVSLAEAFKKRLGGLSTDKVRQEKSRLKSQNKEDQLKHLSFHSKSIQKVQKANLQKDNIEENTLQNKKPVKKPKTKQNLDVSGFQRRHKIQKQNDKNQGKTSRQPSQQLMQRLIHGSRAKISKKQMIALTRKNYEKLPQVKKKKQDQIKKQQEAERLSRIRAYQKQLRSGSSSNVSLI